MTLQLVFCFICFHAKFLILILPPTQFSLPPYGTYFDTALVGVLFLEELSPANLHVHKASPKETEMWVRNAQKKTLESENKSQCLAITTSLVGQILKLEEGKMFTHTCTVG